MDKTTGITIGELVQVGLNEHKSGNLDKAGLIYREILALEPHHFDALHLLGVVHSQKREFLLAIPLLKKAAKINPNYAAAHNNLGVALQNIGRQIEATKSLRKAVSLDPNYADAQFNLGNSLQDSKLYPQAIDAYNHSIRLSPSNANAHYNMGNALHHMQQFKRAIDSYTRAVELNPSFFLAFNNRGLSKLASQDFTGALKDFERAIDLNQNYAEAYKNKGAVLCKQSKQVEALDCFNKTITLEPGNSDAVCHLANTFRELKRYEESIVAYQTAYKMSPEKDYLLGMLLHVMMNAWDWSQYKLFLEKIVAGIHAHKKMSLPFPVIGLQNNPQVELKCTRIFAEDQNLICKKSNKKFHDPNSNSKIKIGYFSADFHDHPVAHLISGMLENHDKSKFEIYGFSHGPAIQDASRQRIENALDQIIDTESLSDDEVIEACTNIQLDIAVDLGGYTSGARPEIFSKKCAPIQINYLGYPGTMANPAYDYIVADEFVIPERNRSCFTEKIIYLPSYQVNDSTKAINNTPIKRAEQGLKEDIFVFACFNNTYKISPEVIICWVNILKSVPNSILWLASSSDFANTRLIQEFEKNGIARDKIIFAKRMEKLDDHLARLRLADLFLDTFFYNAHTTASDALWAGLPVITLAGETFASRVAGSLLTSLNIPELITFTKEEYQTLAISLATEPHKLSELMKKIAANKDKSQLFNTKLYTKNLEKSFDAIHSLWASNASTKNIFIT